jgi:hypothetical protein
MAEKLTDRSELGGGTQGTDQVHVVRSAVSYRRQVSNLFNTGYVPGRVATGNAEMIVFKKDPETTPTAVLAADDILIYIDTTADRMIVGIAVAAVSTYPTDLEDNAKFLRFYDGASLL